MEPSPTDTPESSRVTELLARLEREPGAAQLLALAPPGAFLVGGAVRDLLLGRTPRELDVVLAGGSDGSPQAGAVSRLARELSVRLGGREGGGGGQRCSIKGPAARAGARARARGGLFEPAHARARRGVQTDTPHTHAAGPGHAVANEHERFDTAVVEWAGGRIDIAAARRERYPQPGALPEVEPAPLAEDLLRRDFTANAIAVGLVGEQRGAVRSAPHALEDLAARQLRVLHERSFLDDPTRLWRLARYRARLGFSIEPHTAELAAQAVAGGALAAVSGARLGAETRLALAESDPLAALGEAERLGLLAAVHPRVRFEPELVRRALELLAGDDRRPSPDPGPDRPDVLVLASLLLALTLRADASHAADRGVEAAALLDRLEFAAAVRDRVVAAALAVPRLVDALARPLRPSELRAAVLHVPPEGVALAGALGESSVADAARRWLGELRHVRLRIDGGDLLAGGVPEGPEVGRRLEATLRGRLDGELPDEREAQLRAALAE